MSLLGFYTDSNTTIMYESWQFYPLAASLIQKDLQTQRIIIVIIVNCTL